MKKLAGCVVVSCFGIALLLYLNDFHGVSYGVGMIIGIIIAMIGESR